MWEKKIRELVAVITGMIRITFDYQTLGTVRTFFFNIYLKSCDDREIQSNKLEKHCNLPDGPVWTRRKKNILCSVFISFNFHSSFVIGKI